MSYTHFTLEERKSLQEFLSAGYSMRKIADLLGRSPSTISREIKRNRTKYPPRRKSGNKYWYNSWRAQTLYIYRRREKARRTLSPDTEVWNYIVAKLKEYWSPETIANTWREKHPDAPLLSVSTIYRYIARKEFPGITKETHLRRRGKRSLPRNSNYNTIQPDRIIPDWPEEIKNRSRIGDWEGDTVYGGVGKGFLVTLVDRKTRCLRMGLLHTRNADETRIVIERLLNRMPVKSVSLDNGSEFADFRTLEKNIHAPVYFAEPHKPWQRGTNENTNDIVRFFFPKGFDFRKITDEDVQFVEDLINNRPRKCLNWRCPADFFR